MWRRAWVNGVDEFWSFVEPMRIIHNKGMGALIQGTRDWRDYTVTADVTPHLAKSAGLAAPFQVSRRYYALLLRDRSTLSLACVCHAERELMSIDFPWAYGTQYELGLAVQGNTIRALVDGETVMSCEDATLECGGIALLVEEGRSATKEVKVSAG